MIQHDTNFKDLSYCSSDIHRSTTLKSFNCDQNFSPSPIPLPITSNALSLPKTKPWTRFVEWNNGVKSRISSDSSSSMLSFVSNFVHLEAIELPMPRDHGLRACLNRRILPFLRILSVVSLKRNDLI